MTPEKERRVQKTRWKKRMVILAGVGGIHKRGAAIACGKKMRPASPKNLKIFDAGQARNL
jgi:hypothetical protein